MATVPHAASVTVFGGTGTSQSLEKMTLDRQVATGGHFVRQCIVNAKEPTRSLVTPNSLCAQCALVFGEDGQLPEEPTATGNSIPTASNTVICKDSDGTTTDISATDMAEFFAKLAVNSSISDTRSRTIETHTFSGLIESAENGCHLCHVLLNHIPPTKWEQLSSSLQSEAENTPLDLCVYKQQISNAQNASATRFYVELSGFHFGNEEPRSVTSATLRDKFKVTLLLEPQKADMVPTCPPSINTSSEESMSQISSWIQTCCNDHPECNIKLNETLPTRLIDIHEGVHLVESKDISPSAQYATLSYCWGTYPQPRLLSQNYTDMKDGISLDSAPKTFREAISVTRKLGLRYIWVDALCIIQDSDEDWFLEAAAMGQIYTNSHINIAASASTDANGGLFRQRDPLAATPIVIKPTWTKWSRDPLVCYDQVEVDHQERENPLNKRAWVLQERLLPRRAVSFTNRQIWWTCRKTKASEVYPDGKIALDSIMAQWNMRGQSISSAPQSERAVLHHIWDTIITEYSRRRLTYASDKLIAVSAVARELHKLYGTVESGADQYHAGMWPSMISRNILWSTRRVNPEPDHIPCRSKDDRVPSWSWASIDGPIAPPPENLDLGMPLLRLVEVPVCRAIPFNDPFGAVKGGLLALQAPLCKIPAGLCGPVRFSPYAGPGASQLSYESAETIIFWDDWTAAEVDRHSSMPLYLSPCYFVYTPDGSEAMMYGLVFAPMGGDQPLFRRVGYLDYLEPARETSPFENMKQLLGGERPADDSVQSLGVHKGHEIFEFCVV